MEQKLKEWRTTSQLETHPMGRHHPLRSSTQQLTEQMQIPTARYWTEVDDSWGRVGRRIEASAGDRNPTGRPTASPNLDPWEL